MDDDWSLTMEWMSDAVKAIREENVRAGRVERWEIVCVSVYFVLCIFALIYSLSLIVGHTQSNSIQLVSLEQIQ